MEVSDLTVGCRFAGQGVGLRGHTVGFQLDISSLRLY